MAVKKEQIFLVSGRLMNASGHLVGEVQTGIVCSIDKESVRTFVHKNSPELNILSITSYIEYESVINKIKATFQGSNRDWKISKDPILDNL
ncbi:hypothetical protein [Methylotenera sp.]|uniref:hypothetical protein n=1 Tax=Methylotenera sp. TaxID=2051956 RepID=UPI002ED952CC